MEPAAHMVPIGGYVCFQSGPQVRTEAFDLILMLNIWRFRMLFFLVLFCGFLLLLFGVCFLFFVFFAVVGVGTFYNSKQNACVCV